MHASVFEAGVLAVHTEMYQSWALGEPMPEQNDAGRKKPLPPQPRLSNWHPEDLVAYCGGEYAQAAYSGN